MRVFMSYARSDADFARQLARELKARGLEVWQDEKDIKVGESIVSSIETGIVDSDYFCLLLSKRSIERDWVLREYRTALNRQLSTEGRQPRILPALLERCEPPELMRDIRYADFSRSFREGLEDLLGAMGIAAEDQTPYIAFLEYAEKKFSDIDGLGQVFHDEKWDLLGLDKSYTILKLIWDAVADTKSRLQDYIDHGVKLVAATDGLLDFDDRNKVAVAVLPPLILSTYVKDCHVCGPGEGHGWHGFNTGIIELLDALTKWKRHILLRRVFVLPSSCKWIHEGSADLITEDQDLHVEATASRYAITGPCPMHCSVCSRYVSTPRWI